ncbi:MAG: hypothetical protein DWC04_00795 [Candidatus Poseidoniales archaeon]|nr:MAG: hypothetical protein DWC04_00795 [Candidatus Poseidoniales archaeon]
MCQNWLKLLTSDHFGQWKGVSTTSSSSALIAMVDSIEISRVNIRDSLSLDVSVWMNDPNDMDFRPALSVSGSTFTISSLTDGASLASIELDEDQMEAVVRDQAAELRVKFQVRGMHGELKTIHPIIADGKAKKLATANWKTTQKVTFE